jgi:methylphosphotriester-DNA--protein-cysteine methyltransferase
MGSSSSLSVQLEFTVVIMPSRRIETRSFSDSPRAAECKGYRACKRFKPKTGGILIRVSNSRRRFVSISIQAMLSQRL